MSGKVLVIGSGGREHAIVWKLSQSADVQEIFVAPGSYAIQQCKKTACIDLNVNQHEEIAQWCQTTGVNLVVVGPEDPLAKGIADVLTSRGIPTFGPHKNAAQIESDKAWAKDFMDRHGIPTARWKSFADAAEAKSFVNNADFPALVVKASGLAAGKGVIVASSKKEACEAVDMILTDKKFGAAGESVVIEELLVGEEISVLAFCDGTTVSAMLPSQDHKRIFDGDKGGNTGGMGAYCPCPFLNDDQLAYVNKHVLQATIDGFLKENMRFVGVLYAGLMLTEHGPKVLEFNCRFGDPETEVILPLLQTDLYSIMMSCCTGKLDSIKLEWRESVFAVGVVMASKGYPESSSKGQVIRGLENVSSLPDQVVFHCGTAIKDDNLVTNGGRVLISVSLASDLLTAAARATSSCALINFDGQQYRHDIARKGICLSILNRGNLTYQQSGVDIVAGDRLVDFIKPLAKSTQQRGVVGGIGGFGGLFDPKAAGFNDPLLVSGADGVGTKLKIAQEVGNHATIGIDLVAMCVNDVLAHGAQPLFFLDYFACGKLDLEVSKKVVAGVGEGCKLADCTLIGGETAEMPDMYKCGEYDLAGFSVGAVERDCLLPRTNEIAAGDVVIGLPSSGVHSNGFSLVRKVVQLSGLSYNQQAPFSETGKTLGEELLTPTKIYVQNLIGLVKQKKIKAFAHITGGGLLENIPRILPPTLSAHLDATSWTIPKVFGWLAVTGGINEFEMLRTFNCGIGGVVVIKPEDEPCVLNGLVSLGAVKIGAIKMKSADAKSVTVDNFMKSMDLIMRPFVADATSKLCVRKKRVGVLISGSGTNLQALIDSTRDPTKHSAAEIVLVISNKPTAYGLERAKKAGIPALVISHKDYNSREAYDTILHEKLVQANVDIICLAGFMRILSGEFTQKWTGRMINIHPSLLPLFKGANAWQQALNSGVRVTGCSVHFVEEDVDAGAIIVQETVPIKPDDTEESLLERIHTVEHKAYPLALELVASGRAKLNEDKKVVLC
ncbi:hypothetical protein PPYR_13352 [Photinus pyralis]|uniref:Trifunctional purine biosynthetic protein adenosine-3 n=1 Tax=Photinus pyralis TaxID=7054 RepID=A0A5N4A8U0_PHOPY|nr:trifunctional purine biosynthetic protein adenosine-3 [Photinus pyralis]KAB0793732.1 hypothetical protein PPYR_13352 [Photinus pyralis]